MTQQIAHSGGPEISLEPSDQPGDKPGEEPGKAPDDLGLETPQAPPPLPLSLPLQGRGRAEPSVASPGAVPAAAARLLASYRERAAIFEAELNTPLDVPRRGRVHFDLARLYALVLGDPQTALTHYRAASQALPGFVPAASGARRCLVRLGHSSELPEAIADELACTTAAPERAALHRLRAQALIALAPAGIGEDAPGADATDRIRQAYRAATDAVSGELSAWLEWIVWEISTPPSPADAAGLGLAATTRAAARAAEPYAAALKASLLSIAARATETRWRDQPRRSHRDPLADATVRAWRDALDAWTHAPGAIESLKRWYVWRGDDHGLIQVLRLEVDAAISNAERARRLAHLAEHLDRLGDPSDATDALEEAAELAPDDVAIIGIIEELHRQGRRFEELAQVLERVAADPDLDPPSRAHRWARLGALYADELDDQQSAERWLRAVLSVDPAHGPALTRLDAMYAAQGRGSELIHLHLRAADSTAHPDRRAAALTRCGQLAENADDEAFAITQFRRALVLDPDHSAALDALEALLRRTGRHEQLVELWEHRAERAREPEAAAYYLRQCAGLLEGPLQAPGRAIEVYRRLARDQRDLHDRRDLHDQRDRRDLHDQRDRRDRRDLHDQRDQRDQRDRRDQRDQRDRPATSERAAERALWVAMERAATDAERWDEALDAIAAQRELVVPGQRALQQALSLRAGGICEAGKGDLNLAIAHYEAAAQVALERDPSGGGVIGAVDPVGAVGDTGDTVHALERLCALCRRGGRWGLLARSLERLSGIDMTGDGPVARLLELGEVYEEKLGAGDAARRTWLRALAIAPNNSVAMTKLRAAYRESHDWQDLRELLEAGLRTATTAESQATLSCALGRLCERHLVSADATPEANETIIDDAIRFYSVADRLWPGWPEAVDALVRVGWERDGGLLAVEALESSARHASGELADGRRIAAALARGDRLGQAQEAAAMLVPDLDAATTTATTTATAATTAATAAPSLAALLAASSLVAAPAPEATTAPAEISRVATNQRAIVIMGQLAEHFESVDVKVAFWNEQGRLLGSASDNAPAADADADAEISLWRKVLGVAPDNAMALLSLERLALARDDLALLCRVDARSLRLDRSVEGSLSAHRVRLSECLEALGDVRAEEAWKEALLGDRNDRLAAYGLARVCAELGDGAGDGGEPNPSRVMAVEQSARLAITPTEAAKHYVSLAAMAAMPTTVATEIQENKAGDADSEPDSEPGSEPDAEPSADTGLTAAIGYLRSALLRCPDDQDAAEQLMGLAQGERVAPIIEILSEAGRNAEAPAPKAAGALFSRVARLRLRRLGDVEGAYVALDKAISVDPERWLDRENLGLVAARLQRWDVATEALEGILGETPDDGQLPRVQVALAQIYLQQGLRSGAKPRHGRIRELLDALLAADPSDRDALSLQLDLAFARDDADAIESAFVALAGCYGDDEYAESMLVATARGQWLRRDDRSVEAAAQYLTVIEGVGLEGQAHRLYRELIPEHGSWAALSESLRRFIAFSGEDDATAPAEVYATLAQIQAHQMDDRDAGVATLQAGMVVHPMAASLKRALVDLWLSNVSGQAGIEAARELVEATPRRADGWRALAVMLESADRSRAAAQALVPLVALEAATESEAQAAATAPWLGGDLEDLTAKEERGPGRGPIVEALELLSRASDGHGALARLVDALDDAVSRCVPEAMEPLGLEYCERFRAGGDHPLRALVDSVAAVFDVTEIDLYVSGEPRAQVRALPTPVAGVLVPAELQSAPLAVQRFLIARAIALISRGAQALDVLSDDTLITLIDAACKLSVPGFKTDRVEVRWLGEMAKRLSRALPRRSRRIVEESAHDFVHAGPLKVAGWRWACFDAATWVAVLVSGDLAQIWDPIARHDAGGELGDAVLKRWLAQLLSDR